MKTKEQVNHPSHYGGDSTYEHIRVVDAWGLNYRLGNATKYICRAGKKTQDGLRDLEKALWYVQSEIDRLRLKKVIYTTHGRRHRSADGRRSSGARRRKPR